MSELDPQLCVKAVNALFNHEAKKLENTMKKSLMGEHGRAILAQVI